MSGQKLLDYQRQGIFLLIAAALIWAPIPYIPGETIGALIVLILGIYNIVLA
ncbi:hypothetical protein GF378_01930 [Candidatus Pacearchaeota archaeon]|nr:hypothetical protein [Candidatus Pacearchaeota archaeon]